MTAITIQEVTVNVPPQVATDLISKYGTQAVEPVRHTGANAVIEFIAKQIKTGAWSPGEVVPSRPELARMLGVKQNDVTDAYKTLYDEFGMVRWHRNRYVVA